MGSTSIEWTDRSVNPFRAKLGQGNGHYCEKISQGCRNCYSSRMQRRFGMPQFQEQRRAGVEHHLHVKALEEVLKRRKPTKWFWCDMTDMFGSWVPFEWIAACFGVMAATPHHTHQVLTKRPERMLEWFEWAESQSESVSMLRDGMPNGLLTCAWEANCGDAWGEHESPEALAETTPSAGVYGTRWPLPNVWIGTSVEDQPNADKRVPLLIQCPAAVRFLSVEPMIGPVDLTNDAMHESDCNWLTGEWYDWADGTPAPRPDRAGIDWVVVGGESGPGSRPFDLAWARALRDQCRDAGVAYYFKQVGARYTDSDNEFMRQHPGAYERPMVSRKGGDIVDIPEDLRIREFPEVRP